MIFFRLKGTDPYVAICFSFGNDLQSYAYAKDIEQFKKALHYSIVFNDNSLLNQMIDLKDFKYDISNDTRKRRLQLRKFISKQIILESIQQLEKLQSLEQLERLQSLKGLNIILTNKSYNEIEFEKDSVIYCDPPYLKVIKKKRYNSDFNHNSFYDWARKQNNIFISEYTMPDDFEVVYQKEKMCCLGLNNNTKTVEKLFVNNGHKFAYTQNNLL